MPSTLARNLNLCFSKMMRPLAPESPPISPTPHDHNPQLPIAATPSTCPSSILIKNFNSLFDHTFDSSSSLSTASTASTATTAFQPEPEPADFATAFASQRFFFSSPGRSNSITDCTPSSSCSASSSSLRAITLPAEPDNKKLFSGSVAVPTYSPDPYLDFRQSMQEMVEARPELMDVKSNWEILHELLLCYLALNPKSTHKFILGAFADLLVSLMTPQNAEDAAAAGGGGRC